MKIRNATDLLDRIAQERIWRIREIAALKDECRKGGTPDHIKKVLRRSFVPIAYAHWEGFVKKTTHYYLEFVSMQRPQLGQLVPSFQAITLWSECSGTVNRNRALSLIEVCATSKARNEHHIFIPYRDVISTNSNLDSRTLKEICELLNVPFGPFEPKSLFIDSALVGRRNHIAHGEKQDIDDADLETIKSEVVSLIDSFRNEVENAATLRSYLSS